jgi:hypothetical protein
MTTDKKAPTRNRFALISPSRPPSTARVDPAAFREALARAVEHKERQKRALARQLADSVARRAPARNITVAKRPGRGDLTKIFQVIKRL